MRGRLPIKLWGYIYNYDSTYREVFSRVICHINLNAHILQMPRARKRCRYIFPNGTLCIMKTAQEVGNVMYSQEPCYIYARVVYPLHPRKQKKGR